MVQQLTARFGHVERKVRALAVLGAAGLMVGTSVGVAAPDSAAVVPTATISGPVVQPAMLGIHSYSTRPELPTGAMRINLDWRSIQPSPGTWSWRGTDELLARANGWGYRDVIFAIAGTPVWAATSATKGREYLGPRSASPPNTPAFKEFMYRLSARYRGRVTGYEIWNEPTVAGFYQGSAAKMAEMTAAGYLAIRRGDPRALVLSASPTTHHANNVDTVFRNAYFAGLRSWSWPVDVVAGHFYPPGETSTPAARRAQVIGFKQSMVTYGGSRKPLWDTETNFLGVGTGGLPNGRITGATAAAYITRYYLDNLRLGVQRGYWYMWTNQYLPFAGIQTRPRDAATYALQRYGAWVVGAHFQGCRNQGPAVLCKFNKAGKVFWLAWSETGTTVIDLGPRLRAVTPVFNGRASGGRGAYRLTALPVRIES